ncbi:hypothetical protein HZA97_02925 [Candidatus Woesearchaeota archaeon]|nr:hypothetical protein [Candidatus Woesearchaeota archaeon]
MVVFNQKNIGFILIGVSLMLITMLVLIKNDIDKRDSFLCENVHKIPELKMEQCPAHTSNTSWILVFSFGLAFLILGSGIFLVVSQFKKEIQEFKKLDFSKLDKEEKQICELLSKSEGSMYQSDLIKETGHSKVKITRILDKLEARKIIDRKRRGMTNIIILR